MEASRELAELTRGLEAWRERLTSSMLRVSAGLGSLLVIHIAATGGPGGLLAFYVVAELLLLGAAFRPQAPHWLRSGVLLLLVYLVGASSLWVAGLEGNGRLFLIAAAPLTLILHGSGAGVAVLALTLATHAAFGALFSAGVLQPALALDLTLDPDAWRRSLLATATLSAALMVPLDHLVRGQVFAVEFAHKNQALEQARAAAEQAAAARARFLAMMSHELRTPMNGVLGVLQLLEDSELSGGQRVLVQSARESGEALLTIIGDVLDFSRIEAGALEVERAPTNLRECVERALDVIAPQAYQKGLELGYWLEPGAPECVLGDAGRLRQILVNLLGNALKFTQSGEIRVVISASEGEVALAVSDTGVGIPPDRQALIFEPFRQADGSVCRSYGGSGLGLSICRELAALMGGRLQVSSAVGEGSTFVLTLPAGRCEQPAVPDLSALSVALVTRRQALARAAAAQLAMAGLELECVEHIGGEHRRWDVVLAGPDMDAEALLAAGSPVVGILELGALQAVSAGLAATLPLPLKSRSLWLAVARAADLVSEEVGVPAEPCGLRILVADDHPVNQLVTSKLLSAMGHRVEVVGDGEAAVDAVLSSGADGYDLVLMDCLMSGMDGLEATRCIRARLPPAARPRIVALTAFERSQQLESCREAGMDDVLSKPLEREALLRVLRACA